MTTVHVPLGERAYDILIGPGLLPQVGDLLKPLLSGRQILVAFDEGAATHADILIRELNAGEFTVISHKLPRGEPTKCNYQLTTLWDVLAEARFGRDCAVMAVGGGVAGDLVGFAAATYMRGVDFVQVPTSLLAMVDSSVGGKTGINHPVAKNLIGAFWQPRLVLADTDTLRTLPEAERVAALAEIIKYGVIYDADFFVWLEENIAALRALEAEALTYAIRRSCEIKAEVVVKDEREGGLRKILNFGHTIGHAVENSAGYGRIRHGEAIGIGMAAESVLAVRRETPQWGPEEHARLTELIQAAGLPVRIPAKAKLTVDALLAAARADKKNRASQIRYALPVRLGTVEDATVPEEALAEVLHEIGGRY